MLNYQQTAGRVVFCHVPDTGDGGTQNYPTTMAEFRQIASNGKVMVQGLIASGSSLSLTPKMVDVDAIDYRALDVITADGWSDVCIFVQGATASVAAFDVDLIWHLEATPRLATAGVASQPAEPANPMKIAHGISLAANAPVGRVTPAGIAQSEGLPGMLRGLGNGARDILGHLAQSAARGFAQGSRYRGPDAMGPGATDFIEW
jgi:hypothetical protein